MNRVERLLLRAAIGLLIGLGGWAPAAAQVAADHVTVPVQFQGLWSAGGATPSISISFDSTHVATSSGAPFGQTTNAVARLRPGKNYTFTVNPYHIERIRVKLTTAADYRIFINGVEHEMFDWANGNGSPLNSPGHFTVRIDDGSGAPVGEAGSIRPGVVLWSVGLGYLKNGKPAGSLMIAEHGLTAGTFTPHALYYSRDTEAAVGLSDEGQVEVIKQGLALRQVYATTALADITTIDSSSYLIRIFPRDTGQIGSQDLATGIYAVTGTPLFEFKVENPSHPALDALRITKTVNQEGSLTAWTEMRKQTGQPAGTTQWLVHDWVVKPPDAVTVDSPVRQRWTYSDSDRNELIETLDGGSPGSVVRRVFRRFDDLNFGFESSRELTYEQVGPAEGNFVRTNYTYHQSVAAADLGAWHKVKHVSSNDGSWTAFEYENDYWARGRIKQIRRPFKNAPASDPGNGATAGESVNYTYFDLDAFGTKYLNKIERSINGVLVGKTELSYAEELVTDTSSTYGEPAHAVMPVVVVTQKEYSGSEHYLTTVTRTYRQDADPEHRFFTGLPHSVIRPDGTAVAMAYFRADFHAVNAFHPSTTGGARVRVALHGTTDTEAGIPMPTYSGAQSLPANFRIVDGKSIRSLTLMGEAGLPRIVQNEVYLSGTWNVVRQDWQYYVNSLWPSLVQRRSASFGAFWNVVERTWAKGQMVQSVDDTGVHEGFSYDSVGRMMTGTLQGASYTENNPLWGVFLAPRSVTRTYDAGGAVLSERISSDNYAESITKTASYDLAGRVVNEQTPLVSQTSYTYDVSNRRVTLSQPAGPGTEATRVEERYIDGQLASVSGSLAVAASFDYDRDPANNSRTTVTLGGGGRVRKVSVDWLGRTKESRVPGFSVTGMGEFVESVEYDPVKGLQTAVSRTGYAPTRYSYDAMSQLARSGLDITGGGLQKASADRIGDFDTLFESHEGAIWSVSREWAYPYSANPPAGHAQDERKLMSETRRRITGLSPALRAEERSWDADGILTQRTVTVDAAIKLVAVNLNRDGFTNTAKEMFLNGLLVATTGFDGLRFTRTYDALGRLTGEADPRTGTQSTTYFSNSAIVQSVTDAAGKRLSHVQTLDAFGRPSVLLDAYDKTIRRAYNHRGQLVYQWGSAVQPVSYIYNENYGERTALRTYQQDLTGGSTWDASDWPGAGVTHQETRWEYDGPSGLLWRKYDAADRFVEYTYNIRGQTATRAWSRKLTSAGSVNLTTTYSYDGQTGELTDVAYNDAAEPVRTAPLKYSYTRLGQIEKVWDGTNAGAAGNSSDFREFIYDPAQPGRLAAIDLPSFYNTGSDARVLTRRYDAVFRPAGFKLGTAANAVADLDQSLAFLGNGRLGTVSSAGRVHAYGYLANSSLVSSLVSGSFTVDRTYESQRDLLAGIEAKWGSEAGATRTKYAYTYNNLALRESARQTGSAFDDYSDGLSYQGTVTGYEYSARQEVTKAIAYRGSVMALPGASNDELPGRRFHYTYDRAGNRKTSGPAGVTNGVDDNYQVNNLNQYAWRENNTVRILGTARADVQVAAQSTGATPAVVTVTKRDRAYAADIVPTAGSGPSQGTLSVYASPSSGANTAAQVMRNWFLPPQQQVLAYDLDGNLKTDGVWSYDYDAENRLVRMTTLLPPGFGNRYQLTFKYDYLGRRVEKRVMDLSTTEPTEISSRRYLYDGWDLVAEFAAPGGTICGALVRSYTWGLDIAGSLSATGSVGALLQIRDHASGKVFFPTYDGNGNVASLVNADSGLLAAVYEYGPFGEVLRAEVRDATVAGQPFQFSTKFSDSETGLVYYGARFYSSTLGRFINRDPIEEEGGLNLYGFCGNDGVNGIDVWGLSGPPVVLPPYDVNDTKINTDNGSDEWDSYRLGNATDVGEPWIIFGDSSRVYGTVVMSPYIVRESRERKSPFSIGPPDLPELRATNLRDRIIAPNSAAPRVTVESHWILRSIMPGQVHWDHALTAAANGDYGYAVLHTIAMGSEIIVTVVTLGTGSTVQNTTRATVTSVESAGARAAGTAAVENAPLQTQVLQQQMGKQGIQAAEKVTAGRTIGLGLDLPGDLARTRAAGALTYEGGAWQKAGLTTVDWGKASVDSSWFRASFREAAKNADGIRFDVSNFSLSYPKPGMTTFEFNHVISTPSLLQKTNFIQNGESVIWNGASFVRP